MRPLIVLVALCCGGCATSLSRPVLLTIGNNLIMRGTTTADLTAARGLFEVTDGKVTCSGDYDQWTVGAPQLTVDFTCTDGGKGVAIVNRSPGGGLNGAGTLQMSDGRKGTFVYGDAAAAGAY